MGLPAVDGLPDLARGGRVLARRPRVVVARARGLPPRYYYPDETGAREKMPYVSGVFLPRSASKVTMHSRYLPLAVVAAVVFFCVLAVVVTLGIHG